MKTTHENSEYCLQVPHLKTQLVKELSTWGTWCPPSYLYAITSLAEPSCEYAYHDGKDVDGVRQDSPKISHEFLGYYWSLPQI